MMNRTALRSLSRALVALAAPTALVTGALLAGCNGKVLSFTGTSSAALGDVSGIDAGTTIAQLTDEQANQVCEFVTASFPYPDMEAIPPQSGGQVEVVAPGYVNGGAFGCVDTSPQLLWVYLSQSDCVANLRHSACEATLSSLEQCVEYLGDTQGLQGGNGSGWCTAAHSMCAAFEGASGCDQTVFQASIEGDGGGACASSLPVEAGATCPADAGTD
jgi:hypothetical protein